MARIRTIKPEFWADEDLSALPIEAHMLAAALLNYADDEGYFNANPKLVEAACRPLREDSVSVHECLKHLSNVGYLDIGEGSDGKKYGCIRNFAKHQRINRPSESKIAKLSITWDGSRSAHGVPTECSLSAHGVLTECSPSAHGVLTECSLSAHWLPLSVPLRSSALTAPSHTRR